ncbi:hypothetical protein HBN50_04450 [Halobacteriovorax sp. GB3]|uniref:hypothetical protein n=1 Tax=Halobacteriovorax sp. GB3 TaxID=2719615 RepID=UPI0023603FD3|nr:hypothetical protein [Halobacteriovorax sp. GB3]MDD0852333.1 hypothetical protein [Halobacteriovorax sp. GB3]
MKFFMLSLLSLSSYAGQLSFPFPSTQCMEIDQAREILREAALSKYTLCLSSESSENECVSEEKFERALSFTRYFERTQLFRTGSFLEYYCAPGAQCWEGLSLDCNGNIRSWFRGED